MICRWALSPSVKAGMAGQLIDHYVRFATVCLKRYASKVNYWIVINQINLIFGESFQFTGNGDG